MNRPLEVAEQADIYCTVGVSTLDAGDAARRIDYVFVDKIKGVRESRVVFNTLMVQISLPCPIMPVSLFQ